MKKALDCVAPGGILMIFHRWSGRTLERLSRFLDSQNLLHHQQAFDVKLDLSSRSTSERQRVSRYTGGEIGPDLQGIDIIYRTMGCIAVEPHSCCTCNAQMQAASMENAKKRVNWRARSKTPALVVIPNSVAGIQSCIRGAALKTVGCGKISVIGGGHSENCFHDDAIVIDMVLWRNVKVDPLGMTVRVGGGATIGEITSACEKHGLVVPLGDRPGVGMGLILQGGLNHFMRKFGLACDNILRVVYVSPTGKLEVADNDEDLWLFRGAGTNFGIVIEVTLQAHKLESVWVQHTEIGPCDDGEMASASSSYAEMATALPETAALDCYLYWSSHKDVAVVTCLFDTCREFTDREYIPKFLRQHYTGGGKVAQSKPTTYKPTELFDQEPYMTETFAIERTTAPGFDPPSKVRSIKLAIFLTKSTDWSILERAIRGAPTTWCYIHIMPGGESVKNMPESSFGCRNWAFVAVITARYPDEAPDEKDSCESWITKTVSTLLPYTDGVYGSDLGPADFEHGLMAFGNHSRLLANMKRKLDPLNVLSCGCPLFGPGCESNRNCGTDPRVTNPGIVIVFCGRRSVGKDWLAEITKAVLEEMMTISQGDNDAVGIARISDSTKREYAASYQSGGVDANKLINDRQYKELHRKALTDFYNCQRARDLACDVKSFQATANHPAQSGILLVTGMRHGLEYARLAAGKAVVMIKVTSSDCSRRARGWVYDHEVDDSEGEERVDSFPDDFWELEYENEAGESTKSVAEAWVKRELAPKILNLCIRKIPDTPRVGVEFKDLVGSLLLQPFALSLCCGMIADWLAETEESTSAVDAILSPGDLGYVFAGALGARLMKPVILARKAGKLQGRVDRIHYNGSNITKIQREESDGDVHSDTKPSTLEIVSGSIQPGQKILIVDDCLASGATAEALACLVQCQGGTVTKLACIMELTDFRARSRLPSTVNCFSLLRFNGD